MKEKERNAQGMKESASERDGIKGSSKGGGSRNKRIQQQERQEPEGQGEGN